ncbi:MAG: hypothetical protein HEP71_01235 [Roseivirga sp.]|nr:hypothetical protein [Roseivirga sp.]
MSKQKIQWRTHFIELLVVIIGISIAFALEGWSERRKNRELEINYLQSLKTDLLQDKTDMQVVLDSSDVILRYINETFVYLFSNRETEAFKRHHITSTYTAPYFYPKNGTYISLVNSGNLNLIRDFEIKSSLADLYDVQYEEIARVDGVIRNLVDNMIYPYVIENVKFSATRDGVDDVVALRENKAINLMGSYLNFLNTRKSGYLEVDQKRELLLEKIDQQISELR